MPKESERPLLSHLPTFDAETGELAAVIETPRKSRNKYDFDDAAGAFKLAGVLPEGTVFPYDFGFIPSTVGEDGDPLDVLIFLDEPAVVGCVLAIRLIGVIEAEQREGDDTFRNDRLLAVASHAHTHEHVKALDDLRPGMIEEIEAFFGHYNQLKGKQFRPLRRAGPDAADKLVKKGQSDFQAKEK